MTAMELASCTKSLFLVKPRLSLRTFMKQRCLSEDFIAINDKQERLPWVFMCDEERGKESSLMETQKEGV